MYCVQFVNCGGWFLGFITFFYDAKPGNSATKKINELGKMAENHRGGGGGGAGHHVMDHVIVQIQFALPSHW